MGASPVAFCQDYSAPTVAAISDPFEQIGPVLRWARQRLLADQQADGAWQSWRLSNGSAEAEALLLLSFLDRQNDPRSPRLMQRLFDLQQADGGWAQFPGGPSESEFTALVYFALRSIGLDSEMLMLRRARERLLAFGRGISVSPRTRLFLALFGQLPYADDWSDLVAGSEVEDWALQVLNAYKPVHPVERDPAIAHLISGELPRRPAMPWNPMRSWSGRKAAQQLREYFGDEPETPGAGPTSVLPLLALSCLQLPASSADLLEAWRQFDSRCRSENGRLQVTPLLAPQRDTARAILTLLEAGMPAASVEIQRAGAWLWHWLARGQARGDMAAVDITWSLLALARSGVAFQSDHCILLEHVTDSLLDEQADDGSWGSPETTGLALEALAEFGLDQSDECIADAAAFLEKTQQADGFWLGATAPETVYQTLRAICGLRAAGRDCTAPPIQRGAAWLKQSQPAANNDSAIQVAWSVSALLAAGEANSPEVNQLVNRLLEIRHPDHGWHNDSFAGHDDGSGQFDPMDLLLSPLAALAQFQHQWAGLSPPF